MKLSYRTSPSPYFGISPSFCETRRLLSRGSLIGFHCRADTGKSPTRRIKKRSKTGHQKEEKLIEKGLMKVGGKLGAYRIYRDDEPQNALELSFKHLEIELPCERGVVYIKYWAFETNFDKNIINRLVK